MLKAAIKRMLPQRLKQWIRKTFFTHPLRKRAKASDIRRLRALKRPLRVSFIGPWNYNLGLGVASRSYITALKELDLALNIYPISKPFHTHTVNTTFSPETAFEGPADICMINLHPDMWESCFTSENWDMLRRAAICIGIWVWETSLIPVEWHDAIRHVDAIWLPSHYCVDVFSHQTNIPVKCIPYVIPLPVLTDIYQQQLSVREMLHIHQDAKIILFVFDSTNIMSRKNPNALVRAFRASHLAERGWVLVLKTKNLFEHPDAGNALMREIDSDPAIKMLNQFMSESALADLMMACDIYASPHASEGFGLTVAEAMAAGKSVVATDFSATRDFLNTDTGYPVRYTLVPVGKDSNLYAKDGVWAQIDENDLTAQLCQAALDIEQGVYTKGIKARQKIERLCSAKAVAESMQRALSC